MYILDNLIIYYVKYFKNLRFIILFQLEIKHMMKNVLIKLKNMGILF